MTTSLREKIDESLEVWRPLGGSLCDGAGSFLISDAGQELLKWVAEEAVKNAPATGYPDTQNNAYWDEDWWKSFTEGL
jgi:hypothetical protein